MSQENVEVVRRIFEGWAAGDFARQVTDLDADVVFIVRQPFPEPVRAFGQEEIRDYTRRLLDNFEGYAVRATELQAAGDTVVVDAVQSGTGKASHIEMAQQFFMLFTFRGTKIVRIEAILDRAEALEAAGLSE